VKIMEKKNQCISLRKSRREERKIERDRDRDREREAIFLIKKCRRKREKGKNLDKRHIKPGSTSRMRCSSRVASIRYCPAALRKSSAFEKVAQGFKEGQRRRYLLSHSQSISCEFSGVTRRRRNDALISNLAVFRIPTIVEATTPSNPEESETQLRSYGW
jgi:hypothetical protein